MNPAIRCLIPLGAVVAFAVEPGYAAAAERKKIVTSVVSAAIDREYRRTKKADGSYQPEYYALSFGGQAKGTISHTTIDEVPRAEFETLIREHLAKRNYLMAPNSASAQLLIHLLWGMTDPFGDDGTLRLAQNNAGEALAAYKAATADMGNSPKGGFGIAALTPEQRAAESEAESALMYMLLMQKAREQALAPTASVLGYIDPVNDLSGNPAIYAGLETSYQDMWDELSERRYYVLVYAYDFKVLQKNKQLKPLWVTRVSIEAKGNRFNEHLDAMMARAGRYFGRATDGLARTMEGRVEIGEAEVIGTVDDTRAPSPEPDDQPDVTADTPPAETAIAPGSTRAGE